MVFRVEIAPQAFEDLDGIAEHIIADSSYATAERWLDGILESIASLQDLPARCPVSPESSDLGIEVRLLLHGSRRRAYKIYFSIEAEAPTRGIVRVLHVRHWARRALSPAELEELAD